MQLITFLSAATAMVATVSAAKSAIELLSECNTANPYARVINRCSYDVHLWSVQKGLGCPTAGMVTLKTGEVYTENYQEDGDTGVSIKVSKTEQCKGNDIVQLEYYLQRTGDYAHNYLDVSYVDCTSDNCPTKSEGFYLVAGNQTGTATASAGNTWCPILACNDAVSCAKLAYILPDDVQTKTCDLQSNMDFYMCGGEAPDGDYSSTPAVSSAASSSKKANSSTVKSSTAKASTAKSSTATPTSTEDSDLKIKAAAVTSAPAVTSALTVTDVEQQKTKTHVEVVYVTAYEYVNAKRHAHGHARRHQQFRA